MSTRPEHIAPPEIFYDDTEAKKYSSSSRMVEIQAEMTERAYELLALPEDGTKLILDLGCGSGLSGSVLDEHGHVWIGLDISQSMLNVAIERESKGDLILADMGAGMFFRAGMFDAAISISAIQWLCNADKTNHNPYKRLNHFFTTLYQCMARGARCVFQFYPENGNQMEMITTAAMRAGFCGGLVVDYPNSTRAKKYFLCLWAGTPPGGFQLPTALGDENEVNNSTVSFVNERETSKNKSNPKKSRGCEIEGVDSEEERFTTKKRQRSSTRYKIYRKKKAF